MPAGSALAADRGTPAEARAMFDQAVQYMETNGAERAFAAFNNQKGQFVHRKDLYVFVIDDQGVYHASGAAPEALVGLKVLDTTDAAGMPLFREMIDSHGQGARSHGKRLRMAEAGPRQQGRGRRRATCAQ
ncbi:hypothetical protein [Thauera humireducens]|uniref:hypothetical protein n=1 Tax=Thauera humireducens TaxID=1134435 RepID=UPI00311DE8F8